MSVQSHITIKTHNNQPYHIPYTIYHTYHVWSTIRYNQNTQQSTIPYIYHIPFIIQIISFLGCTSAFSRDFTLLLAFICYLFYLLLTYSTSTCTCTSSFDRLRRSIHPPTHRVCTCTWTPNCKTSSLPSPSIQFNPWFVFVPVWFRDSNLSDLTAASKQAPSPCTYLYLSQYQYRLGRMNVCMYELMNACRYACINAYMYVCSNKAVPIEPGGIELDSTSGLYERHVRYTNQWDYQYCTALI